MIRRNNIYWSKCFIHMRLFLFGLLVFLLPSAVSAQFKKTVEEIQVELSDEKVNIGDTIELNLVVDVIDDWYLYSSEVGTDEGPMAAELTFIEDESFQPVGGLIPVDHKQKFDNFFSTDVNYFPEQGKFIQKVIIKGENPSIRFKFTGQTCSDVAKSCALVNQTVTVPAIEVSAEAPSETTTEPEVEDKPDGTAKGAKSHPAPADRDKTEPAGKSSTDEVTEKPVFNSRVEELKWEKEQLLNKNPDLKENLQEFVNKYGN